MYTSSCLALAVVETRVHLRTPPIDYIRLTIDIAETGVAPEDLTSAVLEPSWRNDTSVTRRIGDLHFRTSPLAPLKVPSVAVDTEWNLLFHADWGGSHALVVDKAPMAFDLRMWG